MKTLKELTWEHQKEKAENQFFINTIMSGQINPEIYAIYLFNQHQCYNVLESIAMSEGIFDDMPELRRAPFIKADFDELWTYKWKPAIMDSTKNYLEHCKENLMDNPDKITAHIYVRHMGDLSGGQIIKPKVPGQGTYYNFNIRYVEGRNQPYKNIKELEEALILKVNSYQKYSDQSTLTENINSVVYEARMCFGFTTELFKDMQKFIKNNETRFGNGLSTK
jgi:heme oxygenase